MLNSFFEIIDHLTCWLFGHAWQDRVDPNVKVNGHCEFYEACLRCGTRKRDSGE